MDGVSGLIPSRAEGWPGRLFDGVSELHRVDEMLALLDGPVVGCFLQPYQAGSAATHGGFFSGNEVDLVRLVAAIPASVVVADQDRSS